MLRISLLANTFPVSLVRTHREDHTAANSQELSVERTQMFPWMVIQAQAIPSTAPTLVIHSAR